MTQPENQMGAEGEETGGEVERGCEAPRTRGDRVDGSSDGPGDCCCMMRISGGGMWRRGREEFVWSAKA